MKRIIIILACLWLGGCAVLQTTTERATATALKMAEKKAEELHSETGQIQGGVQAVNPTAETEIEVIVGTIVRVRAATGLKGVAGTVSLASQAAATQPAK